MNVCLPFMANIFVVPADKASNNILFLNVKVITMTTWVSKELGISKNSDNPTYKNTSCDKEEILANHKSFVSSMNIQINEEYDDLPTLLSPHQRSCEGIY